MFNEPKQVFLWVLTEVLDLLKQLPDFPWYKQEASTFPEITILTLEMLPAFDKTLYILLLYRNSLHFRCLGWKTKQFGLTRIGPSHISRLTEPAHLARFRLTLISHTKCVSFLYMRKRAGPLSEISPEHCRNIGKRAGKLPTTRASAVLASRRAE